MECPINKKFSKNFLDYYEIKSPNNEEVGTGCGTSRIAQDLEDIKFERRRRRKKIRNELNRITPAVETQASVVEEPQIANAEILRIPERVGIRN